MIEQEDKFNLHGMASIWRLWLPATENAQLKTLNVTNSAQIRVGAVAHGASYVDSQITGLCKTTHSKSGNNDDKPSGKWTHIVRQEITSSSPPSFFGVWMTNSIPE